LAPRRPSTRPCTASLRPPGDRAVAGQGAQRTSATSPTRTACRAPGEAMARTSSRLRMAPRRAPAGSPRPR
jgi:hypothetical protein